MQLEGRLVGKADRQRRTCTTAERLSKQLPRGGPISPIPRKLEAFIAGALDDVLVSALPQGRLSGTRDAVGAAVCVLLKERNFGPGWLADWMVDDFKFLCGIFQELTGARHMTLHLEVSEDDAQPGFRSDDVRSRLITTYRGPGTQWIEPRALARLSPGEPLPVGAIRDLERGHVAVMRGTTSLSPDEQALLYRSTPPTAKDITRLTLKIDDAADHKARRVMGS